VEEEGTRERSRDSDGSARSALLSLDASIEGLGVLRDMFPKRRMPSSKSSCTSTAFALRRAKFPKARRFKRPVSTTAEAKNSASSGGR